MTGAELHRKLSEPFPTDDVEWRVSKASGQNGLAVPYITSRAIQARLDDTVGPFCWRTRYIPWHQYVPKPGKYDKPEDAPRQPISSQLCGLSIYDEDRQEWVEKIDGAANPDFETIKGGISDSFKRAAVLWGVGRYLYRIGAKWTPIDNKKQITDAGKNELRAFYAAQLQKLGLCTATGAGEQACYYRVSEIQPASLDGFPNAAWVQLVTPENRVLRVFTRGSKPGLAVGVCLLHVQLRQQSGAGGTYYEMQDYVPAA